MEGEATELPALMLEGRWGSPTMLARYTESQVVGTRAIAQYYNCSLRSYRRPYPNDPPFYGLGSHRPLMWCNQS